MTFQIYTSKFQLMMEEHSINIHLPHSYAQIENQRNSVHCHYRAPNYQNRNKDSACVREVGVIYFKIHVSDKKTFHVSLLILLLDYFTPFVAHFLAYLHLIKHLSAGTCGQDDKECVRAWFLSSSLGCGRKMKNLL